MMLPKIKRVVQYINSSSLAGLSIDHLASIAELSRSRMSYLFKVEVGMTVGRFIKKARMERARLLLGTTSLSVRDVMTQVGFSDPSHFVRDFRKVYGLSPSRYRRAHSGE
jgi:AraC-like DNA-binding protein